MSEKLDLTGGHAEAPKPCAICGGASCGLAFWDTPICPQCVVDWEDSAEAAELTARFSPRQESLPPIPDRLRAWGESFSKWVARARRVAA